MKHKNNPNDLHNNKRKIATVLICLLLTTSLLKIGSGNFCSTIFSLFPREIYYTNNLFNYLKSSHGNQIFRNTLI